MGTHTINHPELSVLSADAQYAAIVGSRQRLEAIIERPAVAFAYPYGRDLDFTNETVNIVSSAGFCAAGTTIPSVVHLRSDPFRLRRYWVGDWDLETFRQSPGWYFLQ